MSKPKTQNTKHKTQNKKRLRPWASQCGKGVVGCVKKSDSPSGTVSGKIICDSTDATCSPSLFDKMSTVLTPTVSFGHLRSLESSLNCLVNHSFPLSIERFNFLYGIQYSIMGGSSSKSLVEVVKESITEATFSASNRCITNLSSNQALRIIGNNNVVRNVDLSQTTTFTQSCGQNVDLIRDIQTRMQTAIENSSQAKAAGLNFTTGADSSTSSKIHEIIKTNITTEVMNEIFTTAIQNQEILIQGSGNILDGASLKQAQTILSDAAQKTAEKIVSDVSSSTKVQNTSSATTESILQPFVDLLQSGVFIFFLVIIVVAIIGLTVLGGPKKAFALLKRMLGAKSDDASPTPAKEAA